MSNSECFTPRLVSLDNHLHSVVKLPNRFRACSLTCLRSFIQLYRKSGAYAPSFFLPTPKGGGIQTEILVKVGRGTYLMHEADFRAWMSNPRRGSRSNH